jgi:hypothetical protein
MRLLPSRERAQANEAVKVFSKLEGEIREVVSRDTTVPRLQQGNDNELAASIGSLLQRVSGTSLPEIEKFISELQILREMLQSEAERVQREVVEYAVLIQSARHSMRTISESLSFWQNDPDDTPRISA